MNKSWLAVLLAFWLITGCDDSYTPRTGDLVFQDLESYSSRQIKIATNSPYSHCGIVSVENNKAYVIEAIGPVRKIPLEEWIKNGRGRFTAKRPIDDIDEANIIRAAERFMGAPYDSFYEWDDEKLYCSELVYKAYARGGNVELCSLRRFDDYDIDPVRESIIERYGGIPAGLELVAPADLAGSEILKTVYNNFPYTH
jgi:hypothetical protein